MVPTITPVNSLGSAWIYYIQFYFMIKILSLVLSTSWAAQYSTGDSYSLPQWIDPKKSTFRRKYLFHVFYHLSLRNYLLLQFFPTFYLHKIWPDLAHSVTIVLTQRRWGWGQFLRLSVLWLWCLSALVKIVTMVQHLFHRWCWLSRFNKSNHRIIPHNVHGTGWNVY